MVTKREQEYFFDNYKMSLHNDFRQPKKERKIYYLILANFLTLLFKNKKSYKILSTLHFFSVTGILSPSAGVIQYIKHFAKVLEEGVDKGYLNECWQSNVREDAVEKVCFI